LYQTPVVLANHIPSLAWWRRGGRQTFL